MIFEEKLASENSYMKPGNRKVGDIITNTSNRVRLTKAAQVILTIQENNESNISAM